MNNLSTPLIVSLVLIVLGLIWIAIGLGVKSPHVDVQADRPISSRRKIFLVIGICFLAGGVVWAIIEGMKPLEKRVSSLQPQNVLRLDELPFEAFGYGFGKDFIVPQHFSNFSVINGTNSVKDYKLNFSMPLQGDAAAGIAFVLIEPLDVTNYSYLEAVVQFKNSRCDLYMEDRNGTGAFVTISDTSPDSIRTPYVNGKWLFKLALTNFSAIDLHVIKEIGCNAHRCEGDCLFELSELRFSKP